MLTDAELAIAAARSDRSAFADIYDRYANTLYELCRAVLGDVHEASDAVHDTFVIAATRLEGLQDPSRLQPWLCAIARHESIRRSSKQARNRLVGKDEVLEVPIADVSARGLIAEDAASLVWEAADALTERERAVLVLNVRQGLDGADLAAAAGLPGPTTSVVLSRAKTQLASAVRCTLLVRNGRDDCAELAQIVPRRHAALDALMRKRVARHAATCPICATTWNKTPEALGVLVAAPLVGAPVALRHKVLNDPRLISFSAPLGDGDWQRDGFPPREPTESRRRIVGWLAAAMVTILVAGALVLFAGGDDDRSLAAPRAQHTTTSAAEDFAPWPTDPPHASTTTAKKATTTTAKKATTTTARSAAGGVTATTVAPTTTTGITVQASAREATLRCGQEGHVAATTSQPVNGAFLSWTQTDPATGRVVDSGAKNMDGGPQSFTDTLGPFSQPGHVVWSVTAGGAKTTHTIDVTGPC